MSYFCRTNKKNTINIIGFQSSSRKKKVVGQCSRGCVSEESHGVRQTAPRRGQRLYDTLSWRWVSAPRGRWGTPNRSALNLVRGKLKINAHTESSPSGCVDLTLTGSGSLRTLPYTFIARLLAGESLRGKCFGRLVTSRLPSRVQPEEFSTARRRKPHREPGSLASSAPWPAAVVHPLRPRHLRRSNETMLYE